MNKQALLIGINEYQVLPALKYARQDAEAVAESLMHNYCFLENEIILLTDSRPGLFKPTNHFIIQEHLEKLADQELDLFIFGFWGHGLFRNGKRYLCPLDVMANRAEHQGLPFDLLQELLSNIRAKNTCMILDCCQTIHDRGEEETLTAVDQKLLENAARDIVLRRQKQIPDFQSNVAILNSCKEGQSAYEWDARQHGLFTAHLLDAMKLRSNSVMQIASYISSNIEKTALELGKNQTPFYKLEGDIQLPVDTKTSPLITGDVFISYRHCNADLVAPVEEELKRRGISYFIDRVGINYGMDYSEVIARAVKRCKILLVVWTQEANGSTDMLREVKMALDLKKTVIPYKIGAFNAEDHDALYYQLSPLSRCEAPQQTPETIAEIVNKVELSLTGKVSNPTLENVFFVQTSQNSKQEQPMESNNLFNDILENERKKKQLELERLQKEVIDAYNNEEYGAAISGLEAILKLEPDSTATKELLFVCKSKQELQEANKHNLLVPGTKAGERKTAEVNGVEFAFRWCPPGVFLMGSPESEDGHKDDEKQHEVTLTKGFWIMETPVTQKQWMAVMDNNPSECKGDNLPVEDVSWYDCYDFCKKCVQLGLPLQLPTEAQWEYACRAGSTGAYAGELQEMRFSSSYNRTIYPVGIKKPNAWGIYDMYGNVHNWCTDWYGEYLSERVTDPTGPSHPAKGFEGHVFRGGSMFSSTSANREHGMVDNGIETSWESDYQILGFRCIVKEETLKAGERKTYEVNGVEIAFRWAPAGSFLMGSPESEEGRKDDETQHEVTLTNGFWMMETPVTVGMFKAFVDDTGYESDGYAPRYWNGREWEDNPELSWLSPGFDQNDNHPVTCVSSYDAEEFCKWLSHKTGEYIQLPTEAQWEYACRAGSTGVCAIILDEMAWYRFNSGYTTHPAGLKMPNAWGLYDMHGNVYEWCVDYYSSLSSESEIDPQDCFAHDSQVVRGGSWISKNKDCRSASRNKFPLKTRIYFLGFRCVKGR